MSQKIVREDRPQTYYPAGPDSRGSARVSYNGKQVYFGAHGTAESHATYALWRNQIDLHGTAPRPKELRPIAEAFLRDATAPPPMRWFVAVICVGLLASAGAAFGFIFYSTHSPALVDGTALTDREVAIVRGVRESDAKLTSALAASTDGFLEIHNRIQKLKEESTDGRTPRIHLSADEIMARHRSAKPPIEE